MIASEDVSKIAAARRGPLAAFAVGVSLLVAHASPARAERPSTQRVIAENLFAEGKALMESGRFDEACPKLAESQRIDPGGGTILLLALCHERQGKVASAWVELRAALAAARRVARDDRIATAEEHLALVEPRIAHVSIVVEPGTSAAGLEVVLDGVALTRAAYDSPIPLDPGEHRLDVSAPQHLPWHTSFVVGDGPSQASIVLPPLAEAPPSSRASGGSARPIAIGVAASVSLVALGLTAYWGTRAIVAQQSKPDACSDADAACLARASSLEEQRGHMATLATIGAGVGVAAAGAAITLWLWKPSATSSGPSARVGVAAHPGRDIGATLTIPF